MTKISTTIPTLTVYGGTIPDKNVMGAREFANAVHPYMNYFNITSIPEVQDWRDKTNEVSSQMNRLGNDMEVLGSVIQEYTQYQGDWDSSISYSLGDSISYSDGNLYISKQDGNTNNQPDIAPAYWYIINKGIGSLFDDKAPILGGNLNAGGYSVFNYSIASSEGITIDLSRHKFLVANLAGDSQIRFTNILSGVSEWIVELTANGFTPTWDSNVEWDSGGAEPSWSSGGDLIYFYSTDSGATVKGMRTRRGA